MLTFGIGIDIIEVSRIADQLSQDPRFRHRLFTDGEITYCEARRFKAQNYAARFAAKEALLKALGTGLRGRMKWKDIEVVNDEVGRPDLRVSGGVGRLFNKKGISAVHVSISHVKDLAVAVVVVEKAGSKKAREA
jgi:holo-[acyl-carrier protein] synthase